MGLRFRDVYGLASRVRSAPRVEVQDFNLSYLVLST